MIFPHHTTAYRQESLLNRPLGVPIGFSIAGERVCTPWIALIGFAWRVRPISVMAWSRPGGVEAKVLSHVTVMSVLLKPVNNFLGQVIRKCVRGEYNTILSLTTGPVITYWARNGALVFRL